MTLARREPCFAKARTHVRNGASYALATTPEPLVDSKLKSVLLMTLRILKENSLTTRYE